MSKIIENRLQHKFNSLVKVLQKGVKKMIKTRLMHKIAIEEQLAAGLKAQLKAMENSKKRISENKYEMIRSASVHMSKDSLIDMMHDINKLRKAIDVDLK